jgi:hypothetical protein
MKYDVLERIAVENIQSAPQGLAGTSLPRGGFTPPQRGNLKRTML